MIFTEEKILYALQETEKETYSTVAEALKSYSPRELLGFQICDKVDDPDFMLLDAIVED